MASFPVPLYTGAAEDPDAGNPSIHVLVTANPAAESTATQKPDAFDKESAYFDPEVDQSAGTTEPLLPVGQAFGRGWAIDPTAPVGSPSQVVFDAGTWTVTLHHSRANETFSADVDNIFTAILFRMSNDLSTVIQEIGRTTASQVTSTTTEQVLTIDILADSIEFNLGEKLYLEIHCTSPDLGQTASDDTRLHTQSATATRISAIPNYTAPADNFDPFPVPLYTGAPEDPNAGNPSQHVLVTTDPASESNATQKGDTTGETNAYFDPEVNVGDTTDVLLPVGQAFGRGWAIDPTTVVGNVPQMEFTGGTWTVTVHHSRNSGFGTANINNTFTAILFRMSNDLASVQEEIGRTTAAQVTTTTTEQALAINISANAVSFTAGEKLYLELHCTTAGAVGGARTRVHTQSATATRISTIPNYSAQNILATVGTITGLSTITGSLMAFKGTSGVAVGSAVPLAQLQSTKAIAGDSNGIAQVQGLIQVPKATVGISAGTSQVAAISGILYLAKGLAEGTAIATAIANAQKHTQGIAAGTATPIALVNTLKGAPGESIASAVVDGVLGKIATQVGQASGTADALASEALIFQGVGTSIGISDVSGISAITKSLRGISSGTAIVVGNGVAILPGAWETVGTALGTSTCIGIGGRTVLTNSLVIGTSTTSGVIAQLLQGVGVSQGLAIVEGQLVQLLQGVGQSVGVATPLGSLGALRGFVGNIQGNANVLGRGVLITGTELATVGTASGTSEVIGHLALIQGFTGSIDIGGVGAPLVRPFLMLIDD